MIIIAWFVTNILLDRGMFPVSFDPLAGAIQVDTNETLGMLLRVYQPG